MSSTRKKPSRSGCARYVPRKYQLEVQKSIAQQPFHGVFLDMGLGKTSCVLSVVRDKLRSADSCGVLVVAPLRVARMTWSEEAAKWAHTNDLRIRPIVGSPEDRAAAYADLTADIYTINYENLKWLVRHMAKRGRVVPFDWVVYDESSKMKNPTSVRMKFAKLLRHYVTRTHILTGSPKPNSHIDLWSQIFLLDGGKRLGPNITAYRKKYFTYDPYKYKWELNEGSADAIDKKVFDIVTVIRAEGNVDLPKLVTNEVWVDCPQREQYDELEDELVTAIKALGRMQAVDVEATNVADALNKCRQFTSGAIYAPREEGVLRRSSYIIHEAKLDALQEIIDETSSNVLVMYEFKHEAERILARFKQARALSKGGGDNEVKLWNRGKLPMLVAHPASIGHGLNMQSGGSVVVWMTTPYSLENYEQTVARLRRPGQESASVISHHILCRDTADEVALAVVQAKSKSQDEFKSALIRYGKKALARL